jgi:hypothetical protein
VRQLDNQSQQGEGCDLNFRPVGQHGEHEAQCLSINETRLEFFTDLYCSPGHALAATITPRNGLDPVFTAFVEVAECRPSDEGRFHVTSTIHAIKSD